MTRRHARLTRLTLAMLLLAALALALAPLAEAKGGYGGSSGRRSCTPSDTDGDGVVSDQEREDQCGLADWVPFAVAGGAAVVAGGVGLMSRNGPDGGRRFAALSGGGRSSLDFQVGGEALLGGYKARVVGLLVYRNGDGDVWQEWCLEKDGKRYWLEDDEGTLTLHKPWRVRGAMDPPTVDGKPVRVAERGTMHLTASTGVPGGESRGTRYVDGRLPDGRRVSLDGEGANVEVFLSTGATARGNQVSVPDPAFLA